MLATMVLLALGIVPRLAPLEDSVNVIEFNRCYDEHGAPQLTQLIFWEWSERHACFHVVAWRLWKECSPPPVRDGQGYSLCWHDGEELRRVRCRFYKESWTQHDPEMDDRDHWEKSARRGLLIRTPAVPVKVSP